MYRYAVLVRRHRGDERTYLENRQSIVQRMPATWSVAYEQSGILALHDITGTRSGNAYCLERGRGVVLGQLFTSFASGFAGCGEVALGDVQSNEIVTSRGKSLVDNYWGSYLAVLYDSQRMSHYVFCDPTRTIPCYRIDASDYIFFFSHLADSVHVRHVGLKEKRNSFEKWLLGFPGSSDETAAEGVMRLPIGKALVINGERCSWQVIWDPIAIADNCGGSTSCDPADALRQTVQATVDRWASRYRRVVVNLSGGLDSSIVAGCLARSGSGVDQSYLNMSASCEDAPIVVHGMDRKLADKLLANAVGADERYYARLVAERWGVPLIERQRDVAADLTRLRNAPLSADPSMYFTVLELDDAQLELIDRLGTEAFFSGQAGDSVFIATAQPVPAIDYAHRHGVGPMPWSLIEATAALSQRSIWSVIGSVVKYGWLRRTYTRPFRPLEVPSLVTREIRQRVGAEELETDLDRRVRDSSLPPGKRIHLSGVGATFHELLAHAGQLADHIDPLNSQPVWEMMLAMPTYTILNGGVSRGLARQAFAEYLPPQIRKRQTKGSGNSYYRHVVINNRNLLREQLADGLLVEREYLDRGEVLRCMALEEPDFMMQSVALLKYLAAEFWLQQLSAGNA